MTTTLCFPVEEDRGLLSPISLHFGRAPAYLLVDAATLDHRLVPNAPGDDRCDPCRSLLDERIDVFLVGGIGARALERIRSRRRVAVFHAPPGRVADALAQYIAGRLAVIHEPCRAGSPTGSCPDRG